MKIITLSIIMAMMLVMTMSLAMAVTFESDYEDANRGNDLDGSTEGNTLISEDNSSTSACVDGQSEQSSV